MAAVNLISGGLLRFTAKVDRDCEAGYNQHNDSYSKDKFFIYVPQYKQKNWIKNF